MRERFQGRKVRFFEAPGDVWAAVCSGICYERKEFVPPRRHVTLGSLVQLIIRIAGMLSGAIVAALQARTLSVADFGSLSLIFSINAMAIILSDMGIMNTAIRKLAAEPNDREQVISGLLTSRFLMGLLLSLVGLAASTVLLDSTESQIAAMLVLATLPLGALTATQAISQSKLHFTVVNTLLALQNFLWLAAVLLLALINANLLQFAIAFLLCILLQAAFTWWLCGRGLSFRWKAGLRQTWPLMKQALPLGIGSLAVTGYYRLTGVILYAYSGPEVAGNFSAAFRILDAMQAIPATLGATFLPLMARYFSQEKPALAKVVWEIAVKMLLTTAVLASLVVGMLAQPIVELLYGDEYSSAPDLLAIVIIAFVPVCMGWLLTGVVTARGRVKAYATVSVSVAVVSIGASMVIVPIFGAIGSAIITVVTEFVVMTILAVVVYRETGLTVSISVVWRLLFAAFLTAASIAAVRPLGLIAALLVAAVIGASLILLFRVIRPTDVKTLLKRDEVLK